MRCEPTLLSFQDDNEFASLGVKDSFYQELCGERAAASQITGEIMDKWQIEDPWSELRKGLWRDPGPLVSLSFDAK